MEQILCDKLLLTLRGIYVGITKEYVLLYI